MKSRISIFAFCSITVALTVLFVAVREDGKGQEGEISLLIQKSRIEGRSISDANSILDSHGYGLSRQGTGPGDAGLEDGDFACYVGQPKWRLIPFGLKRVVIRANVVKGRVMWCRAQWESDLI